MNLAEESFVCLDSEFTGLDPNEDRIVEIAIVRFTLSQILDRWETLVDPEHPITPDAERIHHINDSMVIGKPKCGALLPDIIDFIGDSYLVGHAIQYDLAMLSKEAERAQLTIPSFEGRVVDTLRLARAYGDSPNNSLQALATHFNLEAGKSHRAMDDVMLTIGLFRHLVKRYRTFHEILKVLSRPVLMKYMPLGKYKGRLFSEIPQPYLQWALKLKFDDDLTHTIKLELKKRKQGEGFLHQTSPFADL